MLSKIFLFCYFFIVSFVIGQREDILSYKSALYFDSIEFEVGKQIEFKQNCNPKFPRYITNGTVVFANCYIKRIPCKMFITIKDSIVVTKSIVVSDEKMISFFSLLGVKEQDYSKVVSFDLKRNQSDISIIVREREIFFEEKIK